MARKEIPLNERLRDSNPKINENFVEIYDSLASPLILRTLAESSQEQRLKELAEGECWIRTDRDPPELRVYLGGDIHRSYLPRLLTGKNLLTANQSSAETDLTGFSGYFSAPISRSSAASWRGSHSILVDTTSVADDGHLHHGVALGGSVVTPANTNVINSAYVNAPAGTPVSIMAGTRTPDGTRIREGWALATYTATGDWQRITFGPYTEDQDFIASLILVVDGNVSTQLYADGLQLERGSEATEFEIGTQGGTDYETAYRYA